MSHTEAWWATELQQIHVRCLLELCCHAFFSVFCHFQVLESFPPFISRLAVTLVLSFLWESRAVQSSCSVFTHRREHVNLPLVTSTSSQHMKVVKRLKRWPLLSWGLGVRGFWWKQLCKCSWTTPWLAHKACLFQYSLAASIHAIFQARILECVAISSSRGSSWPNDQSPVSSISCIAGGSFTPEPSGKPE